jgi:hypothetical protein
MKTFSLIVPTRERSNSLRQYLESVANTVKYPDRIFIRIIYDDDDIQTKDFILTVGKYPFKIYWHKRERTNFINEDYYNFGARNCLSEESDYLFISADDVRFVVPEWDVRIESKVEMFCNDKPDRLIGVGVKDNTPKPKPGLPDFPCFPLVTKESFKHFGFVLHPFLPTWGTDYTFYLLYNGVGRYLAINDVVYMHHIGVHTKTGPKDATARHVEKVFHSLKGNPRHNPDYHQAHTIPLQIQEFRQHLNNIRSK